MGRISGYGAAQALGCVPQAKALSSVAQVQVADVEDVLQTGGVRGVCSQERLQCYRTQIKKIKKRAFRVQVVDISKHLKGFTGNQGLVLAPF